MGPNFMFLLSLKHIIQGLPLWSPCPSTFPPNTSNHPKRRTPPPNEQHQKQRSIHHFFSSKTIK